MDDEDGRRPEIGKNLERWALKTLRSVFDNGGDMPLSGSKDGSGDTTRSIEVPLVQECAEGTWGIGAEPYVASVISFGLRAVSKVMARWEVMNY